MNIQRGIYTNEEDFNAQVDEIFFNQPKDFILAMNIAPSYEEVIKNFTRIPISPPYVRMVFSDYIYNGFCAVVSYNALNNFLIEKGEVNRTDMDFSFYHVVYLNVSNFTKSIFLAKLIRSAKISQGKNTPDDGQIFFKYIMDGEVIKKQSNSKMQILASV